MRVDVRRLAVHGSRPLTTAAATFGVVDVAREPPVLGVAGARHEHAVDVFERPDAFRDLDHRDVAGEPVTGPQFVAALREALSEVGGQTRYVASSDLSHVGLQFGEPRAVDDQRRMDVERLDRDMLANFLSNDVEAFLAGFEWNRNPTRWCSIGNMAAMLDLVRPARIDLIDYRQAFDEKGIALVSSAAIALME